MDQGISITIGGRVLRLALMLLGAVLGLLVLSVVFGSSPASADDGDDSSLLGGVVAEVEQVAKPVVQQVAKPAQHAAQAVSHAASAVAPAATAATKPVKDAVEAVAGTAPAAHIVVPVAAVVDTTVTDVIGKNVLGNAPISSILAPVARAVDNAITEVPPVIGAIPGIIDGLPAIATPLSAATVAVTATQVAASTPLLAVGALIEGVAQGSLTFPGFSPGGGDPGISANSSAGSGLLATALAGGLFVLLALRRQTLSTPGMPGSPVYETDSSPD